MFGKQKKSKPVVEENNDAIKEDKVVKQEEYSNAAEVHEQFYEKLRHAPRKSDNLFDLPDDEDLTPEEIAEIRKFWDKYSFAYPELDWRSFKAFKNRRGKVEVKHIPAVVKDQFFQPKFVPREFRLALQNKPLLPLLFSNAKQPRTVLRRMSEFYSDTDYNIINRDEATRLLARECAEHRLIVKPRTAGGGRGIFFIEKGSDYNTAKDVIDSLGSIGFVIQEALEQSPFMNQFNPTSVNTLRITSLLWKDEVRILAALVRVGKVGNEVDNYSQGGTLVGLDAKTGKCNNWAFTHDHERITVLPSGLDLNQELYVPGYDKAVDVIKKMHSRIAYIKMVSWDIAIDKDDDPVLIENNFAGMLQIHECVSGPVFGDITEEVLDEYLIRRFSFSVKVGDWLVDEYRSSINIKEYLGKDKDVVIPETLLDKQVKRVIRKAFDKKDISSVTVSKRIYDESPNAFKGIEVNINE